MMRRIAPDGQSWGPPPTTRAILLAWCQVIGGIGLASAIAAVEPTGLLRANLAGVAALLFVLVPDRVLRARGEGWQGYGLPGPGVGDPRTWRAWARGAAEGVGVSLVVLPLFGLAVGAWVRMSGMPLQFHPRLPPAFALGVAVQFLVVAIPEELFYRGFMQTAWERGGPTRRILGAPIGRGFLVTQALFAIGHLVSLEARGLATFFPGLLFGWLRARSGGIVAPAVAHALSNLFLRFLEASFVPPG